VFVGYLEPDVAAIPVPHPQNEPVAEVSSADELLHTSALNADENMIVLECPSALPLDSTTSQDDVQESTNPTQEAEVDSPPSVSTQLKQDDFSDRPNVSGMEEDASHGTHNDSSSVPPSSIRVYTDRTESAPQVETDVQETEEVLPDGTIVRHRVTTTQQRQLISTRVVVEGPEASLPANQEEAERLFGEMGASVPMAVLDSDNSASESNVSTNVQEFEDTLPDGTVVKRRVVTTLRQQTTAEKLLLRESDDLPAGIIVA